VNSNDAIARPGWLFEFAPVVSTIAAKRKTLSPERALLVGISGIDAAGKGFIAARVAEALGECGLKTAVINVDGWLNLRNVRFSRQDAANCFYEHAIRFDAMFEQLVLPLRDTRSVKIEVDFTEEAATNFRKHQYDFRVVDIVLLEGIFLFKPAYRHHFDLKVWIECSFATALKRAITRGQENLSPLETEQAFESIYFPAQRIHIERDNPVAAADIVFLNDSPEKPLH
jgi:uridine kinase